MSVEAVLSGKSSWAIVQGDALASLRAMPSGSVHCVCTSPPYWALRDYGVEGQIGLERTPAEFIAVMVDVFREVRRVLHPTGVLWLNMGDTYSGAGYSRQDNTGGAKRSDGGKQQHTPMGNLGPKQLLGMPWRCAFALQDDGWILRSDIVWSKANCMPEAVTDRPTKSHEYIFLLAKQPRYYYDADAIREPSAPSSIERARYNGGTPSPKNLQAVEDGVLCGPVSTAKAYGQGRNKRTVWDVPTSPFPGSHYAVFPPALVEPMIRAGTSEYGVCAACGAPWGRVVERTPMVIDRSERAGAMGEFGRTQASGTMRSPASSKTLGWQPSCHCNAPVSSAVVLDPFSGAGTSGLVALRLGRRYLGIELNPSYVQLSRKRIMADAPLFNALEIPA